MMIMMYYDCVMSVSRKTQQRTAQSTMIDTLFFFKQTRPCTFSFYTFVVQTHHCMKEKGGGVVVSLLSRCCFAFVDDKIAMLFLRCFVWIGCTVDWQHENNALLVLLHVVQKKAERACTRAETAFRINDHTNSTAAKKNE
jgi:hypothetical protein